MAPHSRKAARSRVRGVALLGAAALALSATGGVTSFLPPAGVASTAVTRSSGRDDPSGLRGAQPAIALSPLFLSAPALAEDDIAGAFVAYGHYLAIILSGMCLTVERLLVKPGMSEEDEKTLLTTDAVYGLAGLLVLITGYLRTTQYGKSWEFYQHEPIFWLKLILVAVTGACSFFTTATILRRRAAQGDKSAGPVAPVSEKLAARMTSIINAQLLAIVSIPLTATLMARGVLYLDWLPWQAGAFLAILALVGLGFRYVKEALDWKEDAPAATA
eukprot:TRINITY_DN45568_c0_g1_i1.p1 TRINITY_DN45568_c0_g1~~TRINITY_DN45568_c0_g1_i1.p1  ORF type:complete len:293 (+),score=43.15 TRINITY_DN45568_c0_g1_i1:59-880(+)